MLLCWSSEEAKGCDSCKWVLSSIYSPFCFHSCSLQTLKKRCCGYCSPRPPPPRAWGMGGWAVVGGRENGEKLPYGFLTMADSLPVHNVLTFSILIFSSAVKCNFTICKMGSFDEGFATKRVICETVLQALFWYYVLLDVNCSPKSNIYLQQNVVAKSHISKWTWKAYRCHCVSEIIVSALHMFI